MVNWTERNSLSKNIIHIPTILIFTKNLFVPLINLQYCIIVLHMINIPAYESGEFCSINIMRSGVAAETKICIQVWCRPKKFLT